MTALRRLFSSQQDCLLCSDSSPSWVCDACLRSLPAATTQSCPQCAAASKDGEVCGGCLANPPDFDESVAAFHYQFPVDQLLHRYKYGAHLALSSFFVERLWQAAATRIAPDVVVAIPLSRERLAERGFNQAAVLADGVARRLGVSTDHGLLRRVRHTQPQAKLEWASRQANVKDAFVAVGNVQGKRVALLDDVMTTGATLNEAARVLKQRGATRVIAWVVARAAKDVDPGRDGDSIEPARDAHV